MTGSEPSDPADPTSLADLAEVHADPRVAVVAEALERAAFPDGHPYRNGDERVRDDYYAWHQVWQSDARTAVEALIAWEFAERDRRERELERSWDAWAAAAEQDGSRVQLEHTDQWLNCHPASKCYDALVCALHTRSDHALRCFPQQWRRDRGILERVCPHGVGHPDPDDWRVRTEDGSGVHGCDGCCELEP